MEPLYQYLVADGILTWREVARLVLLSGVFTALCINAFPENAPTRRLLLLAAVVALAVLPWLLASVDLVWFIEAADVPTLTLASSVPNLLVWLWLAVAGVLCAQHVCSLWREIEVLNALPPLQDQRVDSLVEEFCEALAIEQPRVAIGGQACATTLRGALLVLPADHVDWDVSTLRGVLAHELVHLKRRDDRWMLLTRMLVLVYWWMPWLMWLYQYYVRAMEESCDDAAAEAAGLHVQYVEALADAAGARRRSQLPAMHEHHLVGRVGRFARVRVLELDTGGVYWALVAILLAVTALTGIEPRTPEPVYRSAAADFSYRALPTISANAVMPEVRQRTEIPVETSAAERQRLEQPVYQPAAIYPGNAIRAELEGEVVVEYSVSQDGSVSGARVVASDPSGVFDAAALRAVQNSRYASRYRSTYPITTGASQALRNSNRPPGATSSVRRHFLFRLIAE